MTFNYLVPIIERHLNETKPLIEQLTDDILTKEPVVTGRSILEVILHIIRSLEYYSKGLAESTWEVAQFFEKNYNTSSKIKELYSRVSDSCLSRLKKLEPGTENEILNFNRNAKRIEILQEMLEHSITHRGQLQVYYRLVGIQPAKIEYII